MYRHVSLLLRFTLAFLLLLLAVIATEAETYPAQCRVTTTLNVRQGPGSNYYKIGKLYRNDYITVNSVTQYGSMKWGTINYQGKTGYIAIKYVSYVKPIPQESAPRSQFSSGSSSFSFSSFFEGVWTVVKYFLIGLLILLIIAFWREILQIIFFVAFLMGIGALICHLAFDNADLGAAIGFVVAVLIGVRRLVDFIGVDYSNTFELIYRYVSLPLFYSNRLQHVLSEPWRYMFKTNWLSDGVKDYLRVILYVLRILLYILITPLRLVNAIAYNILVYGATELYDLFYEVLQPSSEKEGAGNFIMWLALFPWRLIKYPIYHGAITLTEGAVWTVIDIFIPAITMYHGTDLTAGQAITCSNKRNDYLAQNAKWTQGTFTASKSNWGGIGVYFASKRTVARRYAYDPYRLSDGNPVMIVCRVSLGDIINYALAPDYVYRNAGQFGNPAVLNAYGEKNGHTTGEWWNGGGGYWEYCMFDWKNRYNHPWRIRPVFVFNFRTGRAQHIKGGMRHWLFDKTVFDDFSDYLTKNFE